MPSKEQILAFLDQVRERIEHDLEWMQPQLVDFHDPMPRQSRSKKYGEMSYVNFTARPEGYTLFKDIIPPDVEIQCLFIVTEPPDRPLPPELTKEKKKKEKKPKEPKPGSDLSGEYFQQVYLQMIRQDPELCRRLEIDDITMWSEFLRIRYGKGSMREVTPQVFIDDVKVYGTKEQWEKADDIYKTLTKGPDPRGYFSPMRIKGKAQAEPQPDPEKDFLEENLLP